MTMNGGCHCGGVRYEVTGEALHTALCHCTDCRRASGAPMVCWMMVQEPQLRVIRGEAKAYTSSEHGRRFFCAECGTSLFYRNQAALPGMVDIQSATLDNPDLAPAQAHIQVADRISWMASAHELPTFERYPPMA